MTVRWCSGRERIRDLVLRVIAKLLIPFVLLFALYVQFHGDFGPGGGFQAGVIIAAAEPTRRGAGGATSGSRRAKPPRDRATWKKRPPPGTGAAP